MPNKLVLQDGVWLEQPASVIDIINPTVVMAGTNGSIMRLLAYVALAKVLA